MLKSRLLSLLCLAFTVFSVFSVFFTIPVNAALRSPPYVYNTVVFDTRLIEYPVAQQGYTTQSTNITPLFSFTDSSDVGWYVYRIHVTTDGNLTGTEWTLDSYSSASNSVLSDVVWSRYDARLVFFCATTPNATSSDLVQLPLYNYTQQLWNVESMPAVFVTDGCTFTFTCLDYFYEVANSATTNTNNGYLINRFAWANDYRTYYIPEEDLDGYAQGFAAGYTEGYSNGYKGGLNESTGYIETAAGYWMFKERLFFNEHDLVEFTNLIYAYVVMSDEYGATYRIPSSFTVTDSSGSSTDFSGFEVYVPFDGYGYPGMTLYYYNDDGDKLEVFEYWGDDAQTWYSDDYRVLYYATPPVDVVFAFLSQKAYYIGPIFIYDAYQAGYLAGVESNTSSEFVKDILGETLSAPVRGLDSIILYQSGTVTITLWNVLGSAIVLLLFVAFLKMFAGG